MLHSPLKAMTGTAAYNRCMGETLANHPEYAFHFGDNQELVYRGLGTPVGGDPQEEIYIVFTRQGAADEHMLHVQQSTNDLMPRYDFESKTIFSAYVDEGFILSAIDMDKELDSAKIMELAEPLPPPSTELIVRPREPAPRVRWLFRPMDSRRWRAR